MGTRTGKPLHRDQKTIRKKGRSTKKTNGEENEKEEKQ